MESIEVLPIRTRITAILRKALLSGEYAPGDELSLTDIAAQMGVSRTPVREAFQSLAAEGLLELRINRGAIVVGIDEKFIRDHFEVRILLESEAVARATEREMDVTPLQALQAQAEAGSMTEKEYRAYNQRLHTEIWKCADNQRLYHLMGNLWNGPSAANAGRDLEHEAASIREHRQILDCIAARDLSGGKQAMTNHLTRSMDNILHSFRAAHAKEGDNL